MCDSLADGDLILPPAKLLVWTPARGDTNARLLLGRAPTSLFVVPDVVNRALRRAHPNQAHLSSLNTANLPLFPRPLSCNQLLQVIPPRLRSPSVALKPWVFDDRAYTYSNVRA